MNRGLPRTCYYLGESMLPTLVAGELLEFEAYLGASIRRGDVIVFAAEGKDSFVIHRVHSVCNGSIRTRGDNSRDVDSWIVAPSSVLGRVTHSHGTSGKRSIVGGFPGHAGAMFLRFGGWSAILVKPALAFYRRAFNGSPRKLRSLDGRVRVNAVKRKGGTE